MKNFYGLVVGLLLGAAGVALAQGKAREDDLRGKVLLLEARVESLRGQVAELELARDAPPARPSRTIGETMAEADAIKAVGQIPEKLGDIASQLHKINIQLVR